MRDGHRKLRGTWREGREGRREKGLRVAI